MITDTDNINPVNLSVWDQLRPVPCSNKIVDPSLLPTPISRHQIPTGGTTNYGFHRGDDSSIRCVVCFATQAAMDILGRMEGQKPSWDDVGHQCHSHEPCLDKRCVGCLDDDSSHNAAMENWHQEEEEVRDHCYVQCGNLVSLMTSMQARQVTDDIAVSLLSVRCAFHTSQPSKHQRTQLVCKAFIQG